MLCGLSFGLSFLILWGWGWFPHRQYRVVKHYGIGLRTKTVREAPLGSALQGIPKDPSVP